MTRSTSSSEPVPVGGPNVRTHPHRYLSEKEAADFLGFSRSTLLKLRTDGLIPATVISRRCIRYQMSDLSEFMGDRRRGGDGDPASAAKGRVDSKMGNRRRAGSIKNKAVGQFFDPIELSPHAETDAPKTRPSDFGIKQFAGDCRGRLVVGFGRASTQVQRDKGSLDRQKERVVGAAYEGKCHHVMWRTEVGNGGLPLQERTKFYSVLKMAMALRAILLVESTDRLLRHPKYTRGRKMNPDPSQFEELRKEFPSLVILTLEDPDASLSDQGSFQSESGQAAKGNKGGRPTRSDPDKKPEVLRLKAQGHNYREIEEITKVKRSTAQRWVKRAQG